MREFEVIRRLYDGLPERPPEVVVPIGDDCAVVRLGNAEWVVAADMLVYGHHFLDWATPEDVGYKAVAVNVSDVAAMGCEPRFILCSGGSPDSGTALRCMEGMLEAAREFGVYPLGGDTTGAAALTVDVTIIGGVPAGGEPVLRSGARAGDLLAVTGELGASAAGFLALEAGRGTEASRLAERHLRPEPRVEAGRAASAAGVRAMIDLSDGLASDVRHLCERSGVGCRIELERLPVAGDTRAFAESEGRDPGMLAATGGEDYELLVAAPEETLDRMRAACGTPVSVVGEITAHPGVEFLRRGERQESLSGWDHFSTGG
ncbi:thiamine-phosphate kinase [Rubrobacter aplysinae]|uniref:thiamine-phosphate kinase n=1 Tax=Rubrobacter aplysinae TaxID=909625 RepID=UPI00069DDBEA|nr:thiamine-phosphate kinase [Rubrobacter aplysinae]